MKNEIKISRLMDAYTDNEFFIQGKSEVNMDAVKNNVALKAAGAKRKMKPLLRIMIAAAAAAVLAVGTAAAALIISGSRQTAAGSDYYYEIGDNDVYLSAHLGSYSDIFRRENDRFYFELDGSSTDITDMIDRQTPYIYAYTNDKTGDENYIIMGGTPEEYAIIELTYIEGMGWKGDGAVNGWDSNFADLDSIPLTDDDGTVFQRVSFSFTLNYTENGTFIYDDVDHDDRGYYHSHAVVWTGDAVTDTDIPETWQEDCMDAWLINALLELEIIPNING